MLNGTSTAWFAFANGTTYGPFKTEEETIAHVDGCIKIGYGEATFINGTLTRWRPIQMSESIKPNKGNEKINDNLVDSLIKRTIPLDFRQKNLEFLSNGLSADTLLIDMSIILEQTKDLVKESQALLQKAISNQEAMELLREKYYIERYPKEVGEGKEK